MQKGFTIIELLIVIAIIGIIAAVGAAAINGPQTQCIGGYMFTKNVRTPVQVMDDKGHGIPCK